MTFDSSHILLMCRMEMATLTPLKNWTKSLMASRKLWPPKQVLISFRGSWYGGGKWPLKELLIHHFSAAIIAIPSNMTEFFSQNYCFSFALIDVFIYALKKKKIKALWHILCWKLSVVLVFWQSSIQSAQACQSKLHLTKGFGGVKWKSKHQSWLGQYSPDTAFFSVQYCFLK